MQIKKDLIISTALVLLSGFLLVAAKADVPVPAKPKLPCPTKVTCCKAPASQQGNPASPWNFVTEGILHLSA